MENLTEILFAVENGDVSAPDQLLTLIYDELRRMAAVKLTQERQGQTLQATALVHEVYLRLFKEGEGQHWNSRGHFFSAVSEAMRRILIEQSRRRLAAKRGGNVTHQELHDSRICADMPDEDLIALDEALEQLDQIDREAGQIVRLRFFGGLKMTEAADVVGISERSAYDLWAYARAWLKNKIQDF